MHPAPESPDDSRAAAEAAQWIARRDRGMTPAEQDAYLQWLRADPRHARVLAQLEHTWKRLDQLVDWRPRHSARPNPDLLAPRRSVLARFAVMAAAAAAVVVLALFVSSHRPDVTAKQEAIIHPGPERLVLDDGSIAELRHDAQIEVEFTPETRRVRLLRGEAYFSVAKDPARPFVVTAGRIDVRAVGTEFSVSLENAAISVLVTEGQVQVDDAPDRTVGIPLVTRELSRVTAGQQALIRLIDENAKDGPLVSPMLSIREITPAEVESALAWQSMRLEFIDLPLRDVVREFNRFNARKLVVADEITGSLRIGGNFQADNVESFIRLLDSGFGVSAVQQDGQVVLRYKRAP